MPSFFKTLQKASFNGIKFPVSQVRVVGGIRDHDHEYPHSPGSAAEKMGRKSYTIQMLGLFYQGFPTYPNLYPTALDNLRDAWEQELTADLIIPTIGTISAYCRNWETTATSKALSGETVEMTFIEDQSQLFLSTNLISAGASNLASKAAAFNAQAALEAFQKPKTLDLLSAIQQDINGVLAIKDTANAVSNLMSAKLGALVNDIRSLDNSLEMQSPSHSVLLAIMHDLWAAAQDLGQNLSSAATKPKTFVTRVQMSVSQASTAIYGNTSQASTLMQLNNLPDPFAIAANTSLLYYP